MKKLYFLIVVASIFLSSCNLSLNEEAKIIEREAIYREFINALNTSDSNIIKSKIIKHWSDTLIGKENRWLRTDMNYWLAANKEFGNLTFVNYATDSYNGNPVSWFQGDFTKDWIGLEFDFNNKNKITGTNVLRSCLPTNSAALLNSDSLRVQSKNLHFYFSKLIEQDLFSGMVLIAKGDSILHEYYGGQENKEQNKPITSNSEMVIASTTKMFTAIAIAQLVEQEKLDLHTPISNYLPNTPEQIGSSVTIENLLTHTSGIELDDIEGFMKEIEKDTSVSEFYRTNLKYLPKLPNFEEFRTNEEFNYSNENFDFLGKLIEVASGKNYYEYLQDHIFSPLGMKKTSPIDLKQNQSDLAIPYQINRQREGKLDEGFRDAMPYSNLVMSRPAGSFKSTAKDMYKFMYGLNKDKLTTNLIKRKFTSKKVPNLNIPIYKSWYGYGFYINERNGNLNFGHAGGIPGVSSRCEYYPEQDIYIIVISNYNGSANMVANHLSNLVEFF